MEAVNIQSILNDVAVERLYWHLSSKDTYSFYLASSETKRSIETTRNNYIVARTVLRETTTWTISGKWFVYICKLSNYKRRLWKMGTINASAKSLFMNGGCREFVMALLSRCPWLSTGCVEVITPFHGTYSDHWFCHDQDFVYDIRGKFGKAKYEIDYETPNGIASNFCYDATTFETNSNLSQLAYTIIDTYILQHKLEKPK